MWLGVGIYSHIDKVVILRNRHKRQERDKNLSMLSVSCNLRRLNFIQPFFAFVGMERLIFLVRKVDMP